MIGSVLNLGSGAPRPVIQPQPDFVGLTALRDADQILPEPIPVAAAPVPFGLIGGKPGETADIVNVFWPFSGGYRVLALADDYRWAVVGSSTMSYLWFLHRSPQASAADWPAMEQAARNASYDLSGLIRVKQPASTTD